jgi:hypothetical protein
MAEQRIEPAGCLGGLFTLLGIVWLGLVLFAGVFGLRDNPGSWGALIGSTIPALVFLAVGRVLRRRAAEKREAPSLPQPSEIPARPSPVVTEPSPPRPSPVFPEPGPEAPSPEAEPSLELHPPPAPPPARTSQEMIEEARRRWGTGPRR